MRHAVLSDIHANLEALETVAASLKTRGVDRTVVLGDTVGYGANPNECLGWALENADVVLMGNHEKAVVDPSLRAWFNDFARTAIEWTADVLDEKWTEEIPGLVYTRVEKNLSLAHGSLHAPEAFHYLTRYVDAVPSFREMETPVCFVGHTHVPGCFCEMARSAERLEPGMTEIAAGTKYILNPGSVGQPRDGDPRTAFGIYDDEKRTFELVRLDYDNEKAAQKIRKAGLPAYLADRLL